MKRKEVEDVMGGKDAWANVDKTDGTFLGAERSFSEGMKGEDCRDGIYSPFSQRNAHVRDAMGARRFSIRFKSEARTSR